jgi:hypothetical protein
VTTEIQQDLGDGLPLLRPMAMIASNGLAEMTSGNE